MSAKTGVAPPPRRGPPRTPPRRNTSPAPHSLTKFSDGSNFNLQLGGIILQANQLKAVKGEMNDIAIALLTSSDTLRYLNDKLKPGSGAEAQALNYAKSQNAKILDDAHREDARHQEMPEMRHVQAEIQKARSDRILVEEQKRVHQKQHMVYGTSSPPPSTPASLHHAASTLNPYNATVQRKAMESLFGIPSESATTPVRPQQAAPAPAVINRPTQQKQQQQQQQPPPQQAPPAYNYQPYPAQQAAYMPPGQQAYRPPPQQAYRPPPQQAYQQPPYQQAYRPQQPMAPQPAYGCGPYAAQAAPQQALRPQGQAPYPNGQPSGQPVFTSQQFYAL